MPGTNNLRAQQRRFDLWRREFNENRPHEALKKYHRSTSGYDRGINNKRILTSLAQYKKLKS
ncbi:MAG: hypothetical protein WBD99_05330 [Thermodesulfobacteriota bacterium]